MVKALWNFAAECYARPGVAEACLHAQDNYAADVNMLLAAAWLAARGERWQHEDVIALTAMCTDWRAHCVLPLREVRRYLKQKMVTEDMYTRVKALELEAETHQLQLLESMLIDLHHENGRSEDILGHNLRLYFSTLPDAHLIDAAEIDQLLQRIAPAIQ